MNIESARCYCLSFTGVTEDSAFGDDTILFRIAGKIFACIDLNRPNLITAKCEPDEAMELRECHTGIRPAWHWNKRHWNEIYFDEDVPDGLILELLGKAYKIVRNSLPRKLLYYIPNLPVGWVHEHFPEVASTMDCASGYGTTQSFYLITTDLQIKGRGQGGNSWESEKSANLLMSLRFSPTHVKPKDQFLILQIVALAVSDAVMKYVKEGISIKWPNDIYCGNKKLCGILIEHKLSGTEILSTTVGIGININQESFPKSLPNPISLFQILGKETDRSLVLRQIIKSFERYYNLLTEKPESIRKEYHKRLYLLDVPSFYKDKNGNFEACIKGVDSHGQLVMLDKIGMERTYGFKEISYVVSDNGN